MTDLNPESIAELLRLEAKATPGPYHINRGSIYTDDDGIIGSPLFKHVGRDPDRRWGRQSSFRQVEDDLAFIAAARNLIRPLAEAYQRQPDVIKAAVHHVDGFVVQEDPSPLPHNDKLPDIGIPLHNVMVRLKNGDRAKPQPIIEQPVDSAQYHRVESDVIKAAQLEALRGVREWAVPFFVEGEDKYKDGVCDTLELLRDELDRRILALEKKP